MIIHPIDPVFDASSEILILGSFPSVKSREQGFFYGHPQNRFWKVLAHIFEDDIPDTIKEKRAFLLAHHVAVWDVIRSCRIEGSSDASIRDVQPNDLKPLLTGSKIHSIYVNGKTAEKYYRKYIEPQTGRNAVCLPSTSPANAAWTYDRLCEAWSIIKTEP